MPRFRSSPLTFGLVVAVLVAPFFVQCGSSKAPSPSPQAPSASSTSSSSTASASTAPPSSSSSVATAASSAPPPGPAPAAEIPVDNPRRSKHGPGAACKSNADCAQIACSCNDPHFAGMGMGLCTKEGTCAKASVSCGLPCAQGKGPKRASVLGDIADSPECNAVCAKVDGLKCGFASEPTCARLTRCSISNMECAAMVKARLACQAKLKWECNKDADAAWPPKEADCLNLPTKCPPDDPLPTGNVGTVTLPGK
jgi:hypothetical protein